MIKFFKVLNTAIIAAIKLDPIKYGAYLLIKKLVICGSRVLIKSTRNKLDDAIFNPVIDALDKGFHKKKRKSKKRCSINIH